MACFAGYQVKTGIQRDGKVRYIDVPVLYGGRSRLVQYLENGGNLSSTISLPVLSVMMTSLQQKPDMRRYPQHQSSVIFANNETDHISEANQEVEGERVEYIETRYMPVPYEMALSVYGMASNTDQMFQIIEQIGVSFNPDMDLIISNAPDNWISETRIIFEGNVDIDEIPEGAEEIKHTFKMDFKVMIHITPPSIVYPSNTIMEVHANTFVQNDPIDWDTMENINNVIIRAEDQAD
jgi:hypothetical protein